MSQHSQIFPPNQSIVNRNRPFKLRHIEHLGRTLAGGAALLRPHNWMRTAGHGAGYEHTHLPARVAVAVAAAVVPAVALLVPMPVGGEAIAGHRRRGRGARDVAAFWRRKT